MIMVNQINIYKRVRTGIRTILHVVNEYILQKLNIESKLEIYTLVINKVLYNIEAYLIEPLGLVIVTNGNYSVNSAIIHNEGEIVIDTKIYISLLLKKYEFNGKYYIDRDTKEKIELFGVKNLKFENKN